VYVARRLGADTLIATNAAGAVNAAFEVGDIMLIRDHLNLMGQNPLSGPDLDEPGSRFLDMAGAYDADLLQSARSAARKLGILPREGVYAALSGPAYETPAEVRMLQVLGADAVGMSTVPEVIAARHCGMKVLGISVITNKAARKADSAQATHDAVLSAAARATAHVRALVEGVVEQL
jgi:purine-nucleoside phosphorylase